MAGTSGNQPATPHSRRANDWHFADISEAARLLGVSEADVLKQVKEGDLHLNEEDLNTNPVSESGAVGSSALGIQPGSSPVSESQPASSPVSESQPASSPVSGARAASSPVSEDRAVTFADGVKRTGKDPATVEGLVRDGKVRVRVPRGSSTTGGGR